MLEALLSLICLPPHGVRDSLAATEFWTSSIDYCPSMQPHDVQRRRQGLLRPYLGDSGSLM